MRESYTPSPDQQSEKDEHVLRIEGLSRNAAVIEVLQLFEGKVKLPANIISIIDTVISVHKRAFSKLPLKKMDNKQSESYDKFYQLVSNLPQDQRNKIKLLIRHAAMLDLAQSNVRDSRKYR